MIKLLPIMKLFLKKVNTTLSDGPSPINKLKKELFTLKINKSADANKIMVNVNRELRELMMF